MDKLTAIAICTALGQSVRMDVIRLLVKAGGAGLPAGDISDHLGISHNLLSSHLNRLSTAQLVSSEREGRSIRYRARYETLRGLLGYLMNDCCQGIPEIVEGLSETSNERDTS